jgi:CubicO group peptidase (beta-lactamase class C family)
MPRAITGAALKSRVNATRAASGTPLPAFDCRMIREVTMAHPKLAIVLAGTLILISLLGRAVPAIFAAPDRSALQTREQEYIDAYIHTRMQAGHIPGLALGIVRGKEVVYLKGYGIAGPDGRNVTPQTPFILGSTSKSFTALAMIQLVEAGKIDLDAPVVNYLPWFRTADAAASARITVRNLLNQNSGLPVDAGREGFADNDQSDTALENGVRQLAGVQLNHAPGEAYEYANENYTTLGLIIQAVSGSSYEEYIQSQIFAPLHMRHSAATISDPVVSDLASGYRYRFFWPVPFDAPYPRQMTPAGFLIASAEDVAHYLIAQLNDGAYGENHVVSARGIATLHSAGASMNPTSAYGMGWVIDHQPQATRFEHNGDTSTFHSNMLVLPEEQIGIVILTNVNGSTNAAANNIPIEGVAAILLGHSLSPSVDPPPDRIGPLLPLAPLLMLVVWMVAWYLVIRRWQRCGELPLLGMRRFWRYGLPLGVDLGLATLAWLILPRLVHTPMATIRLFAPDVFLSIVLMTSLGFGWALARTILTFRPRAKTVAKWESRTLQDSGTT